MLVPGQRREAVHVDFGADDDAAAVPAVTAVGPAARDLELVAEAHAAVAAVSPFDENRDAVEKHDARRQRALRKLANQYASLRMKDSGWPAASKAHAANFAARARVNIYECIKLPCASNTRETGALTITAENTKPCGTATTAFARPSRALKNSEKTAKLFAT
jgi:hypothetical protein